MRLDYDFIDDRDVNLLCPFPDSFKKTCLAQVFRFSYNAVGRAFNQKRTQFTATFNKTPQAYPCVRTSANCRSVFSWVLRVVGSGSYARNTAP
jgi:hypothetical protein